MKKVAVGLQHVVGEIGLKICQLGIVLGNFVLQPDFFFAFIRGAIFGIAVGVQVSLIGVLNSAVLAEQPSQILIPVIFGAPIVLNKVRHGFALPANYLLMHADCAINSDSTIIPQAY